MTLVRDLRKRADALLLDGQYREALAGFTQLVCSAPSDNHARLRVADALLALGEVQQAATVYTTLARHAMHGGHPLTAMIGLKVLTTLEPQLSSLLRSLADLYARDSGRTGVGVRRSLVDAAGEVAHSRPVPDANDERLIPFSVEQATNVSDAGESYPEVLPPIPLLSRLGASSLAAVANEFELVRVAANESIIQQGTVGDALYILARGTVRVEQDRMDGSRVKMVQLYDGAIFGEMALISDVPRSAHVVAEGSADLLRLSRESVRQISSEAPELSETLERFTRERLLKNLLDTAPLFRGLERGQRIDLARNFTALEVSAGTDVVAEGHEGKGLFVVLKGEVDVWKRDGNEKVLLATLRSGEVFGEIATLSGGSATATVTTASGCTLLFLTKESVQRLMSAVPSIRGYVEALGDQRILDTRILLIRDPDSVIED
jgi:CRP-like cAMP-binding protein